VDRPSVSLRAVPVVEVRALLGGWISTSTQTPWHPEYPQAETFDGWSMLLSAHETMGLLGPSAPVPPWWVHQIVVADQVVGDIGFHGPPPDGGPRLVEIGYGVVPDQRRQGIATAACALLLDLAWRDGADLVTARTDADNLASQRVLLSNGFVPLPDGSFRVTR
jgi:RimJ/RimL family protein N-acetyltransferase